jgi:glycosyltransferase involved in cell wall biosynthesis
LCPEKNHALLLEVAAILRSRRPNVHFLFVGDGDLAASIRTAVEERGLQSHVTLAGSRGDVRDILLGAIDVFAFPSTSEGLPLAVVEAQAAGLPVVLSDAVTPEVEVVSKLVVRRSPVAGASHWADAISDALDHPPAVSPQEARRQIAASPFAIEHSLAALLQVYHGNQTDFRPQVCSPHSHHAHENS